MWWNNLEHSVASSALNWALYALRCRWGNHVDVLRCTRHFLWDKSKYANHTRAIYRSREKKRFHNIWLSGDRPRDTLPWSWERACTGWAKHLEEMYCLQGCSRQVQLDGEKLQQPGGGQRNLAGRRKRTAHWLLHTCGYWVLQRGQFINMKIFPADYYLPQAAIFSLNDISINFS